MGAFDDLLPQTDQTTSKKDQGDIVDQSLNRKVENTATNFEDLVVPGQEPQPKMNPLIRGLKTVGNIFSGSEGIRASLAKLATNAGGLVEGAADPKQFKEFGTDISNSISALFGQDTKEAPPQFGDILRKFNIPEPLAATGGLAAEIATDPLAFIFGAKAKAAAKGVEKAAEAGLQVKKVNGLYRVFHNGQDLGSSFAKESDALDYLNLAKQKVKDTAEAGASQLDEADQFLKGSKSVEDYNVDLEKLREQRVRISENIEDLKANGRKPEEMLAEIDKMVNDASFNQIKAGMIDRQNDLTKRTIFTKNPNPLTSLVQTYISNQGPFGEATYRLAERASDLLDSYRAKWLNNFGENGNIEKIFGNLSKEQRFNFFATMEGIEQAADPVVEKLVNIARVNRTDVANEAIRHGVHVKNTNTGTSKFFSIKQNHMPHYVINPGEILKGSEALQESLEYGVKRGAFKNMDEAQKVYDAYAEAKRILPDMDITSPDDLKLLTKTIVNPRTRQWFDYMIGHKGGNTIEDAVQSFYQSERAIKSPSSSSLEFSRLFDNPFYDTNPSRVLARYYSSVGKRLGEIQTFGRNNEIVNTLINEIGKDPKYGRKAADKVSDMINLMTGAKRPSEVGKDIVDKLTNFEKIGKLSLAVFMNMTQSANTAGTTGVINTGKAMIDVFSKEGRDYAYKAGVLFSDTAGSLYGGNKDTLLGKIADTVLNVTGFNTIEKTNRMVSALAGKHFATEQAMKYVASNGTNEVAARAIRNMGLTPETILKRGSISEDELLKAARSIANRTQFRNRVLDSPEWAQSQWGRLFNQFKIFAENQTKFIREELINEARQGNYNPMLSYLAVAPIFYGGSKNLKDIIKGRDKDLDTRASIEKAAEIAASMGMLGMYYDIVRSVNYKGDGWVAGLVPAIDTIGKGGSAAFETVRPIANRVLGAEETKILNLKPATRFVAERIPIFGSRIKEAIKTPEDKQKEASRIITEARNKGLDLNRVVKALSKDKRVDVKAALKSSSIGQKRKESQAAKVENLPDETKRALIQLGLANIPTNKRK